MNNSILVKRITTDETSNRIRKMASSPSSSDSEISIILEPSSFIEENKKLFALVSNSRIALCGTSKAIKKCKSHKERTRNQKQAVDKLKKENLALKDQVKMLSSRMEHIERKSRALDIIGNGATSTSSAITFYNTPSFTPETSLQAPTTSAQANYSIEVPNKFEVPVVPMAVPLNNNGNRTLAINANFNTYNNNALAERNNNAPAIVGNNETNRNASTAAAVTTAITNVTKHRNSDSVSNYYRLNSERRRALDCVMCNRHSTSKTVFIGDTILVSCCPTCYDRLMMDYKSKYPIYNHKAIAQRIHENIKPPIAFNYNDQFIHDIGTDKKRVIYNLKAPNALKVIKKDKTN